MNKLFCDLKTDEEKAEFFLSGRGYETGVIAHSIQNDVAMAYHRCAEFKKACAQVCEEHPDGLNMMGGDFVSCAKAIRARGRE